MRETFRLELNQAWEAIDIKTGAVVVIPKGSHKAVRVLHRAGRDAKEDPWLGSSPFNTEASRYRPACARSTGANGSLKISGVNSFGTAFGTTPARADRMSILICVMPI